MTIYEKLSKIQAELKAPKGQYNSFGKYSYRSAEDILQAAKPVIHAHGCILTLSDEVVEVGGRIYIKATATLTDTEDNATVEQPKITVTAFAREASEKKGMDDSQISGTASSYARKYAMNGLFCIDDTKDADTDEYQRVSRKPKETKKVSFSELRAMITDTASNEASIVAYYNVDRLEEMTEAQVADCVKLLNKKLNH